MSDDKQKARELAVELLAIVTATAAGGFTKSEDPAFDFTGKIDSYGRQRYREGLEAAAKMQCSACGANNPPYLEAGLWIHSFGGPKGIPITDVCFASCMQELLSELDREESAALQEGEPRGR